jgi:membrane protease YdiL (CAAX protease family)
MVQPLAVGNLPQFKEDKMSTLVRRTGTLEAGEQPTWAQRVVLFGAFLVCGLAIFLFGSNYFEIFPTNRNLAYNLVVSGLFLAAALGFKRSDRLEKYWRVAFAFFTGSVAFPITLLLTGWGPRLLSRLNLYSPGTSQVQALLKVYEVVLVVVPVLVLVRLSGADLGSIYIQRGRFRWNLGIGGLVFVNLTASALLFFATRFSTLASLGAAVTWGLVFSLANGFMEELWLRGIFLRRFEALLGSWGAILLTSLLFATLHGGAMYLTPVAIPFILVNTFTLGLACGYLMVKTGSIWGAVLLHAASDLFLFIAMLAPA